MLVIIHFENRKLSTALLVIYKIVFPWFCMDLVSYFKVRTKITSYKRLKTKSFGNI